MAAFTEYTDPVWRGLNMRQLKVDEAYLVSKTFYHKPTYLYSLSDECYTVCLKRNKINFNNNKKQTNNFSVHIPK